MVFYFTDKLTVSMYKSSKNLFSLGNKSYLNKLNINCISNGS